MPVATAAAEPPDEPPDVYSKLNGFLVGPNTLLFVSEPAPNSGVLVLPMTIAPALRNLDTTNSSFSGI